MESLEEYSDVYDSESEEDDEDADRNKSRSGTVDSTQRETNVEVVYAKIYFVTSIHFGYGYFAYNVPILTCQTLPRV